MRFRVPPGYKPLTLISSHYKSWGMTGLQALCALFYVAGYALREYGAWDNYIYEEDAPNSQTVLMTFIMSQVFIYVPP